MNSRFLPLFRSRAAAPRRRLQWFLCFPAILSLAGWPSAVPRAEAATYTWDPAANGSGSGGNGTWNTTSNEWYTGTADTTWSNSASSIADFAGTSGVVALGTAITAGGLIFDTAGYSIATGANTLTLGTGGIVTNNTSGTTTISGTVTANGAETWSVAAGGILQFNAAFTSPNTGTTGVFQINSAGTTNITSTFSVAGKATLSGGGTFNLSGTETIGSNSSSDYTGIAAVTVNVTAGTATFATPQSFFIGDGGTGTTGTLNVTGGTASLTSNVALRIGDGYNGLAGEAGNGALTVGGGTGTGTFTTGTTLVAITLGNSVATGLVTLKTNGVLATERAFAAGSTGQGAINFNGGTLQALGTSLAIPNTVTTNIADNGGIIDAQTFTVTIAANFTHSGTAATDGGLKIASSATSSIGAVTLSGILSQTGGLTFTTAGTLSGNNTYSGPTAIRAFVDAETSGNIFGATGTGNGTSINTGGTVRFRDTTGATIPEVFTFNGGTFLTYNAGGTTTLSGPLTLDTNTTISVSPQSTSTLNTTLALTGGIAEGGTASNFTLSRVGAAGGSATTGTASADTISITGASTYGGTTTITDAITNPGVFAVQLSGGDNRLPITTAVTLNTAQLILGNATAASNQTLTGLTAGNSSTVNAVVGGFTSASTLTVNVPTGTTDTYAGNLGGTGTNQNNLALTVGGAGTLTLSGANTYIGTTTVNAGTLLISGGINGSTSVNVGAGALTLSNTAASVLADTGTLSLRAGAALNLNANAGTSEVIAALNLDGHSVPAGTYTAAALQTMENRNYGNDVTFSSMYGETLTITPVPEPATWLAGALMVGLTGFSQRRRLRVLFAGASRAA